MPNILVEKLSHWFESSLGRVEALSEVSFGVESNEILTVLGPSGCGKSTLLRCIGGLLEPRSGRIRIDGKPPNTLRKEKAIGFGFQEPALLNWRTVAQNISFPAEIGQSQINRGEADGRVNHLLRLMHLEEFRDYYPEQLSGGMKHRVALARALFLSPNVLLLDEPLAGLDLLTRTELMVEISSVLKEFSCPSIVVTHSVEEAVFWGTRILILSHRPGTMIDQFVHRAPIPRDLHYMDSPQFQSLTAHCRSVLFKVRPT